MCPLLITSGELLDTVLPFFFFTESILFCIYLFDCASLSSGHKKAWLCTWDLVP